VKHRVKRTRFPVRCLLWVVLLLPQAAPSSIASIVRHLKSYGIPKLGLGQVWISSIPAGLEVRSGENPDSRPSLGRTPLLVDARKLGKSITVILGRKEYGGALPNQGSFIDFSGKTTHSVQNRVGDKIDDFGRAITYAVDPSRKRTLIALFQSRDSSLSEIAHLYPPGTNFRFSRADVEKRLTARGVPPEYVRMGIRLLERGGKVGLPGTNGWLIAEVTAPGQVDLLEPPTKPAG
jgi:hypothetical protein